MIHSLEIENFKGIAARQRIDFAPLTLLFGANSAGKSTILQALLYLHELIERGVADVDRTELGGNVLELGGFARLVHKHDSERAIVLRVEFATPGRLERFGRDLTDFPFPDLEDEVESAWLELTVRFRGASAKSQPDEEADADRALARPPPFVGPLLERVVVGVNGDREPLVWLEAGVSLREGEPLHARVNLGHPIVATEASVGPGTFADADALVPLTVPHAPSDVTEAWERIAIPEAALHGAADLGGAGSGAGSGAGAGLGDGSGFGDARSLPVFAVGRSLLSALPAHREPLRVIPFGDEASGEWVRSIPPSGDEASVENNAVRHVRTFLEMVVLGTTAQLASFLRDAQYLGPLRTVPPRGFLYERAGRITSWADGLAAWDLLLADRLTLVERVNTWLRKLGADCQVVVQQLFDRSADAEELSEGHADKTVRRLLLDTGAGSLVLPSEVGAGISQLIPVIVALIGARGGLTLVEQPEIHVHPAVQVATGDLLIEATTREPSRRMLLVETHSEHLILRLLRRIRETTEKELDGAPAFSEDKLSVLYVEPSSDGVRVRRLRVDERGEFVDRWPKGFFAERMEELL